MKLILVSHGDISKGFLQSAEMVLGETDDTICFGLYPGDSMEALRAKVNDEIQKTETDEEILIMCDLFSGSPYNSTVSFLQDERVRVITGMNFAMILEAILCKDNMNLKELCEYIIGKAKADIIDVRSQMKKMSII